MGIIVEYNMYTAVDVDGIGRKVEPRSRIVKQWRLFSEGIPVGLGDVIACFTTMDGGKIEGAMDVCIGVSEIEPTTKGHKLALWGVSLLDEAIRINIGLAKIEVSLEEGNMPILNNGVKIEQANVCDR